MTSLALDPRAVADALFANPALPKAFRTFLGSLCFERARPYTLAESLATLRAPGALLPPRVRAATHAHVASLAGHCEAALRALGHDPGATDASAWALAERLRLGCWVEENPDPLDFRARPGVVILGGIDWDAIPALATPPESAPPSGGLLFARLHGPTRPTRWSELLARQPEAERPRLEKVRRVAEHRRLVGDRGTAGDWTDRHLFAFTEGVPLYFSRRAWGDFQSALEGSGSYLDWY